MGTPIIYLLIILIWPADNTAPQFGKVQAPSLEACQAAKAVIVEGASKDPTVRSVNVQCLVLARGEKA